MRALSSSCPIWFFTPSVSFRFPVSNSILLPLGWPTRMPHPYPSLNSQHVHATHQPVFLFTWFNMNGCGLIRPSWKGQKWQIECLPLNLKQLRVWLVTHSKGGSWCKWRKRGGRMHDIERNQDTHIHRVYYCMIYIHIWNHMKLCL